MAQSTSSSWLREARRLSSGPGPFRNPTWAGAGPAITPGGTKPCQPPFPPLLPPTVSFGEDQATTPGELALVLVAPPELQGSMMAWAHSAAFWLLPSVSLGTAKDALAPGPAPAAHLAVDMPRLRAKKGLWMKRGRMDGQG